MVALNSFPYIYHLHNSLTVTFLIMNNTYTLRYVQYSIALSQMNSPTSSLVDIILCNYMDFSTFYTKDNYTFRGFSLLKNNCNFYFIMHINNIPNSYGSDTLLCYATSWVLTLGIKLLIEKKILRTGCF